jgi:hypothetical protein
VIEARSATTRFFRDLDGADLAHAGRARIDAPARSVPDAPARSVADASTPAE